MNINNLFFARRPFRRPVPSGSEISIKTYNPDNISAPKERVLWELVPQSRFLCEYYPSGHLINSAQYYPDRIKYDEEKGQFFTEKVVRCSFPFQMIITCQRLVHLAGNDVKHELTDSKVSKEQQLLFYDWQKGWLSENIEIYLYHLYKSCSVVGDGAVVFSLDEGKLHLSNLSFINDDILYPRYDSITGRLKYFGRKFSDYDDDLKETVQWLEVWDEKYYYRFRKDLIGVKGAVSKAKEWFGLSGWMLDEEPKQHGFERVPVVYHRCEEGACWSMVQDAIDKFELAVSYLCQNNMAYAFPIMVLQGDNVEIQGDIYGQVKAITADKESKIGYLERSNNTTAFELQLNTLLKQIFMGSFTVQPPEVHSGDLPGVAVKLIYAPSLDRAMVDAREFDHVIDEFNKLFTYGFGVQEKKLSQFRELNIISYIVPYVHQNAAEWINNLCQAVNSGFLSIESASEQSGLGKNNEFDRIISERKEEEKADLLYQIETAKNKLNDSESSGNES